MLNLTTPANQSRLNAAVRECAGLRVTGAIHIGNLFFFMWPPTKTKRDPCAGGRWSMTDTMNYLGPGAVRTANDSEFLFMEKKIAFSTTGVTILTTTPRPASPAGRTETPGRASPAPDPGGRTPCSPT